MDKLLIEVISAKEKVEKLRKEDSLVFVTFTDLHTSSVQHKNMQKLLNVLKLITQEIKYDAVIDMGDNLSMLGRELHISNSDLESVMKEVLGAIYNAVDGPLLLINGNHDAIGTDFFKPDFWNKIVKNKFGNLNAQFDNTGSYYYIDYEKEKTRLVFLSLPSDSDLEAEYPTPMWFFGNEQLKWLECAALNTENNVILISHVPFFYFHDDTKLMLQTWNGTIATMSYISDLCGRIEDCDKAVGILQDFNRRTNGKLVACLSGHTHMDSIWKSYEKREENANPLPCHQVVTRGACLPEKEHLQFGISVDIVIWTPSDRELNFVRVGDGEDRKV